MYHSIIGVIAKSGPAGSTPETRWILETGFWDDNGTWKDEAFWNDGVVEAVFLDYPLDFLVVE